jgi:acetyl-CoA acetyltransferase
VPEAFIVDAVRIPVTRRDTTVDKMAALPPLRNGGRITAALSSQIADGAAALLTTLVHALERTGGRYGLVTMCEGGGQANVTIIERL